MSRIHFVKHFFSLIVLLTLFIPAVQAQSTQASTVPPLVHFSGTLKDSSGAAMTGTVGVTFALYKDQEGGAPLWLETQNVTTDKTGHYSVQLGATSANGLPADMFVTGEARWLGVQPQGQPEQPRVMLLSVPYALKAGDAQTIGGLPPSAFVLAAPSTGTAPAGSTNNAANTSSASPRASSDVTTSGGTVNTLPLFSTATNIQSSAITQTGIGAAAKIGINIATPVSTLDVAGGTTVRGILTSPATGAATAAKGFNSQPQDFIASVFNKNTSTTVPQKFQWQAEPAGNDTAAASGTLNLLYAAGTAAPAETGLAIGIASGATPNVNVGIGTTTPTSSLDVHGTVNIASPSSVSTKATKIQTQASNDINETSSNTMELKSVGTMAIESSTTMLVQATTLNISGATNVAGSLSVNGKAVGAGTITGVTAGTGLTGGGSSGSVTLNVDATKVVTGITAGTGLTGGGTGGVQTLNVDTTKIPQLSANNTFTGTQTVNLDMDVARDVHVDSTGANNGNPPGQAPALRFGVVNNTGEAISSSRTNGSPNQFGLDFWTGFSPRLSIMQTGNVGIGTRAPKYPLDVNGTVNAQAFNGGSVAAAINTVGSSAVYGNNTATSGTGTNGGSFYSSSPQGAAVVGVNTVGGAAGYFQGPVTVTGNLTGGGNLSLSGTLTASAVNASGTVSAGTLSASAVNATGTVSATDLSASNSIVGNSAVYGANNATSGAGTNGGYFYSASPQGAGVVGYNTVGGWAGYFQGPMNVTGAVRAGAYQDLAGNPIGGNVTQILYSGPTSATPSFTPTLLRTIGTFNKLASQTAITTTWISHVMGGDGNSFCQFEVRVDDTVPSGQTAGHNGAVTSGQQAVTLIGRWTGLASGTHTVSIWMTGDASSCWDNPGNWERLVYVNEM